MKRIKEKRKEEIREERKERAKVKVKVVEANQVCRLTLSVEDEKNQNMMT